MARTKTDAAHYKSLMLRLPTEVLEACKATAKEEHRSMNAQIVHMVMQCLNQRRHRVHTDTASQS